MIIMDVKIENFYSFKNFHINMSYPKRIVDSTIEGEYLEDRPNFRYKKVNILMGGNATGKTSFGKMLMLFANYCKDERKEWFLDVINDTAKPAALNIDFVTNENYLYRFSLSSIPKIGMEKQDSEISVHIFSTEIGIKDNYETCEKRLSESKGKRISIHELDTRGWCFSYPADARKHNWYHAIEDDPRYLQILECVLKTLDPSIQEVIKMKEVENTYAIKLEKKSVIIQNGKILDTEILSSGTKAGLDISYIIASLICDKHDLYYCDELFSYVYSDIEKACLSILIDHLHGRKQLFFTTHNTDILDMQLPKHSFMFLKKGRGNEEGTIRCIYASDFLKRNTDSVKHAVENDLFSVIPDSDLLFEAAEL